MKTEVGMMFCLGFWGAVLGENILLPPPLPKPMFILVKSGFLILFNLAQEKHFDNDK
jgi:uncharacterized protein YhhL (DUF1145 family)